MMMSDDSAILFLLGYSLVTIPVCCTGLVAVLKLFDVPELVGLLQLTGGHRIPHWRRWCAVRHFGWSQSRCRLDTLNGIGLLIVGVTVPILGLKLLGGDLISGIDIVVSQHPEKLNAIGGPSDPTPLARCLPA